MANNWWYGHGSEADEPTFGSRLQGFTATYAVSVFSEFHGVGDAIYQLENEFQASVQKDIETLIPGARLKFESFRVDQGTISLSAVILLYLPATYAGYRLCKELSEIHELATKVGEFVQHRIRFWVEKIYKTDYFGMDARILTVNIEAPDLERDLEIARRVARGGRLGGNVMHWLLRRNAATIGWVFFGLLGLLILMGGVELWARMERLGEMIEHLPRTEVLRAGP